MLAAAIGITEAAPVAVLIEKATDGIGCLRIIKIVAMPGKGQIGLRAYIPFQRYPGAVGSKGLSGWFRGVGVIESLFERNDISGQGICEIVGSGIELIVQAQPESFSRIHPELDTRGVGFHLNLFLLLVSLV